jgi:hypothetical protein
MTDQQLLDTTMIQTGIGYPRVFVLCLPIAYAILVLLMQIRDRLPARP